MPPFAELLQQGAGHAWLFIPSAILLGALHGLTGGLIPCPASITVLLLCLQLKQVSLGMVLVLCFSIGLALTMVLVGAVAALSMRQATQRWSGFGTLARRAPYFSSGLIVLVGLYTAYLGWHGLSAYAR